MRWLDVPSRLGYLMDGVPPAGSRIRLTVSTQVGDREFEGTLVPPAGVDLLTLKLANGYNLSHSIADVRDVVLIEEGLQGEEPPDVDVREDSSLPGVLLIHTGGTIASKVDYSTGAVTARFEPSEILSAVPELLNIARIRVLKLGNMWSDDVRPRHWNAMINATKEAFDQGYEGVVVTHGTDTLHLSAAAMSYAWSGKGGRAPGRIVFTGSQRSPDRGSSDAYENLIAAVSWAANGPDTTGYRDTSVVVMHEDGSDGRCAVLPGCSCRKAHSSKRGAFIAVNQEPLAYISIDSKGPLIKDLRGGSVPRGVEKDPVLFNETTRIHEFVAGPYLTGEMVRASLEGSPDALVIRGTGLGHLPVHDPLGDSPENTLLAEVLASAVKTGIPIIITAETVQGEVNMDVYSKGRDQRAMGLFGHGSLCPPGSAMVKLHHLLSRGLDSAAIKEAWHMDLVGENPPDSRS